ncbi:MAG: mechanosensitive ion channel family protein [Actinomycetota bacterium]|nr:mechanosensitive ion channel family protein [Actinomycetota bacterium]
MPIWFLAAQADSEEAIVTRGLTARDWLTAAAIVLAGIALGQIVKILVSRAAGGDDDGTATPAAQAVGRFVGLVLAAVSLVYALGVIGVRLGPLVGALGIGGLALAFAGQNILANFLASIILQLRHPFRRGDQVTVAGSEGTVDDVNFRTVALRTFDGERVMVPCAQVLSTNIVNHTTLGRRRSTLEVTVAYDTDLERTRALLLEAVAAVDGVLDRPPPEVWVEAFGDSGIPLAVRFWHAPDIATLWRVRSQVAVTVKRSLDGAGVQIPFPQRVLRFVTEDPRPAADDTGATESR